MLKGATVTQLARNLLCVLRTLTPESNFMFRRHFIGYYKRLQIPFIGLEIPIDISKGTYFEWLIAVRHENMDSPPYCSSEFLASFLFR